MLQQVNPPPALSLGATVSWVLVGIIISVVLPLAVLAVRRVSTGLEELEGRQPSLAERVAAVWKQYGGNKYLLALLGAFVIAVVLVFLLGLEFYTARDAALAGFAWESLLNKLLGTRRAE